MPDESIRISVPRAGRVLGLSESASYRAAARGELPGCLKLGRKLIVLTEPFLRGTGLSSLPPDRRARNQEREAA